jgi:hypothetical protein
MNELKKMNVYDVNETIENALMYGVDEWGEILEEEQIKQLVDKLEMTMNTKLEYMGKLVVNVEPFIDAIDNEIKKLQDKKKSTINGVNRTKDYLDRFIRHTFTDEDGNIDLVGLTYAGTSYLDFQNNKLRTEWKVDCEYPGPVGFCSLKCENDYNENEYRNR